MHKQWMKHWTGLDWMDWTGLDEYLNLNEVRNLVDHLANLGMSAAVVDVHPEDQCEREKPGTQQQQGRQRFRSCRVTSKAATICFARLLDY